MPPELTEARRLAAETALNDRLVREGRNPGTYTGDELLEAYASANTVEGEAAVDAALGSALELALALTAGDPAIVTEDDLKVRAREILEDKGFYGVAKRQPSEDDELRAVVVAIDEVGRPGTPRKDAVARQATLRDDVIDRAVGEGKILASRADEMRQQFDKYPAQVLRVLAASEMHPVVKEFHQQSNKNAPLVLPEPQGAEMHMRAEQLIRSEGWGVVKDTGDLEYDSPAYMRAMAKLDLLDRIAAEKEAEAKAAA